MLKIKKKKARAGLLRARALDFVAALSTVVNQPTG